MSFSAPLQLEAQDVFEISSTKLHNLGTLARTPSGKLYRYTLNGAVDLAAGLAVITPARVTNHTEQAVAAAAIGADQVTVTVGATAVTTDQYIDGQLTVVVAPGIGQSIRIRGHTTVSSGGGAITVYLAEPLKVALTTSSKVSLVYNRQASVIVHPGSSSSYQCAGVTNMPVTAAYYFWAQTAGEVSVLSDQITAKAAGVILTPNAVAGAVTVEATTTVTQRLGYAPEATVDAKYYPVVLTIDR